jgi:nitrate reductase (cytochrome)
MTQGIDRRAFVKAAGFASVGALEAMQARGVPGVNQRPAPAASRVTWHPAPCRLCGVGCGLLVGVESGRAVAVRGDPDSPVSRGLPCVKGYHATQALYAPDRLTRALVRRNGVLAPASLSDALDAIARELRASIARHGRNSVAMYGSAQWTVTDAYVAAKFFKGALGTNNVDTSARLDAASAAAAALRTFGTQSTFGCHEDVDHADVIVLWDANLAETHPVLFSRMIERRRTNPAVRIIHLATRTTRTSYAADQSLQFQPGSETMLADAVCNEIAARGWAHRGFVDRFVAFKEGGQTAAEPADEADERVRSATWKDYVRRLADSTPEQAQSFSGLPAEKIRWLASLYGDRSRRVLSVWGVELNQRPDAMQINTAIHNIHLLTGKIASPGNGVLWLATHAGIGSATTDAGASPDALPAGTVSDAASRKRAADIWGVQPDAIDAKPGRDALEIFRALGSGEVRFLWIQATNPLVSLPNLSRYRRAAARRDVFIVVSEIYPTATTDIADVVLPAATWLEREGVTINGERRVQHFVRVLQPPGDAADDSWQIIEVARRMGFASMFPGDRPSHVTDAWNEYRRFHANARIALPSMNELRRRPGVVWPFVGHSETRWRFNAAHDPAADRSRGAFDFYEHDDHRAWIWLRSPHTETERPGGDYPFALEIGPVLEHAGTGTLTRRIPILHRAVPSSYAELNKHDAARLGVRDGDRVRLVSRRGAVIVMARVEHRSQPRAGSIFVPNFDDSVAVAALLPDIRCPRSGQPQTGACAIRVERLNDRGDE